MILNKKSIKPQIININKEEKETLPYEISEETIRRLKPIDRKRKPRTMNYKRR